MSAAALIAASNGLLNETETSRGARRGLGERDCPGCRKGLTERGCPACRDGLDARDGLGVPSRLPAGLANSGFNDQNAFAIRDPRRDAGGLGVNSKGMPSRVRMLAGVSVCRVRRSRTRR